MVGPHLQGGPRELSYRGRRLVPIDSIPAYALRLPPSFRLVTNPPISVGTPTNLLYWRSHGGF
ncbi:hypothetical protein D3C76_193910 [compost metagenome]